MRNRLLVAVLFTGSLTYGQLPLKAIANYTQQNNQLAATDSSIFVFANDRYTRPALVGTIPEELDYDSLVAYQLVAGEWTLQAKTEKEYTIAGQLNLKANYTRNTAGWLKQGRQLRTYDNMGNVIVTENQFGYTTFNTWNNQNRQSTAFDSLGRQLKMVNYDGNGLSWDLKDSTVNFYGPTGALPSSSVKYILLNAGAVAVGRSSSMSGNYTLYENYDLSSQTWDKTSRSAYFTGGGNVPDSTVSELWSAANSSWTPNSARAVYSFSGAPVSIREYYAVSGIWNLGKRYTYQYHDVSLNILSSYLYENPLPVNKTENFFDSNGNLTSSISTSYLNGDEKTKVKSYNSYNAQNLLTEQVITSTNLPGGITDSVSKAGFSYENGQLKTWDYKIFDSGAHDWVYGASGFHKVYYYPDTATADTTHHDTIVTPPTGLTSVLPEGAQISIYPVPARNELYISTDGIVVLSYALTDMNGCVIMTQEAEKGSYHFLKTDHLAYGMYFLHVHTRSDTLVRKVVIVE